MKIDLGKFAATIEGDAEKVIKFLSHAEVKIDAQAPKALAALGVLIPAIEKALADANSAAANPVSLVLSLPVDIADFKAVWPDLKSFLESFGAKV